MRLRHTTHRDNMASIDARGLLTAKATGRLKAIWLHTPGRSLWAMEHVARRHRWRLTDLVTIEVDVPRSLLRRSGGKGLWNCVYDVPPERLRGRCGFVVVPL